VRVRRRVRWPLLIVAVAALVAIGGIVAAHERTAPPSVAAYCRDIGAAQDLDQSLAAFDPDALAPQIAALKKAAQVAPAEIAPQVDTLLQLTQALQATLQTSPTDQAAAVQQTLRDHQSELQGVTDAGQAVEAYTRDNCGIDLNATALAPRPTQLA
jgi:hypothetical protein